MAPQRQPKFVVAGCCPGAGSNGFAAQPATALMFHSKGVRSFVAPFAWIRPSQGASVPPLARMANSTMSGDGARLLRSLLSDDDQEEDQPKAPPRRGHNDEWYQERCVFCAHCKSTINSQYQKRGSRCHGCRRWFHSTCMPTDSRAAAAAAPAAAVAGRAASEGASAASKCAPAGPLDLAGSTDSSPAAQQSRHSSSQAKLFHSSDCQEVYSRLSAIAAAGEQELLLPARRSFLPWQQQQQQPQLWRLLDLSEVRHLYKDAQKRGMLQKQHAKVLQQLAKQQEAAAAAASASSSAAGKQELSEEGGAAVRRVVPSRLDDFLVVSELICSSLGDTPKDLLEDSFAIITRTDRGAPTCVATFNVYGSDHARLQGLTTPQGLQRRGHATRLMQQLESVLQNAGLQQLVVIVEQQQGAKQGTGAPPAAIERWLMRQLGYSAASSEQRLMWRRELPEYHKSLIGDCNLVVKRLAC